MEAYQTALTAYLAEVSQNDLADAAETSQANISRYAKGRLPSREIAERIDRATQGKVSLGIWQLAMAARVGITGQAA